MTELEPLTLPDQILTETTDSPAPGHSVVSSRSQRRDLVRALLRSKTFVIGTLIVAWWVIDAIAWHLFVPHSPQAISPGAILKGPSGAHLLGTDWLGRDVLSRVLAGASSVLTIAPSATVIGVCGGTTLGLITGYYRGVVDEILMRIIDGFLSFPGIVIAILVLSVLGSSELNEILVIGILFTPNIARTVRSAVLEQRDRDYVAAARLRGERGPYIMAAELLPNITGPLAVEATVRFGYAVFTAATLSFLALGVQQPSPDWGLTIALGRSYLQVAPWVVIYPAIALATLVVGINLLVDGLKQVLES
jgi:peptide/nickel transport system permease protein